MRTGKRRSGRSNSRANGGGFGLIPWGVEVEPEDGPIFRRSWKKTLVRIAGATVAALAGVGISAISIFGAAQAWSQKPEYLIFILLALAVFALLGLCLVFLGAIIVFVYAVTLVQQERFVLGKQYLQCLHGTSKANMQLPYENMRALDWATKTEPNGASYRFIGIDLVDLDRDDTIVNPAGVAANRKNFGYDQVIFDDYDISLKKFFDRLTDRWERATRDTRDDEDE
jgi:hypothetical protein